MCELLSTLDGPAYIERVSCDSTAHIRSAKKAIRRAFQNQVDGVGYSFVEVVATCPTNWGMTPQGAFEWLRENMLPYYPLGVYKDVVADGFANAAEAALARSADCPSPNRGGRADMADETSIKTREMLCVLAGFGGQGVLFAGKVMANAGLIDGRNVSWMPSYGPEMRGGTANCNVSLSDDAIGTPFITRPTALIAMNQPSLEKFATTVVAGGTVVVDTTRSP